MRTKITALVALAVLGLGLPVPGQTQTADTPPGPVVSTYPIQPGDLLEVSVWREDYLEREVLVQPDGMIAFPLAGDVRAAGRTITNLREDLARALSRYIPEPVVTVSVKEIRGNRIYVIGQVQRPGQFVMNPTMDVMQALALAGGTTPFAALNDIKILRRDDRRQTVIDFRYGDVEKGRNLEQNIVLQSGDVIVVP